MLDVMLPKAVWENRDVGIGSELRDPVAWLSDRKFGTLTRSGAQPGTQYDHW